MPFSQMLASLGSNLKSEPDVRFVGGEVDWARAIGDGSARVLTGRPGPTVEAGSQSVDGDPAGSALGGDSASGRSLSVGFREGFSWARAEVIPSKRDNDRSALPCT